MTKEQKENYKKSIRKDIINGLSYFEIVDKYTKELKKCSITRLYNQSIESIENNTIDNKNRLRAILNNRYNNIYNIAYEEAEYEIAIEVLKNQQKLNRLEVEDEQNISYEEDKKILCKLLGIDFD